MTKTERRTTSHNEDEVGPSSYAHPSIPRVMHSPGQKPTSYPKTWLDDATFSIFKVEMDADNKKVLLHWTSEGNGSGILELNFSHPFRPGLGTETLGKRGARRILNSLVTDARVLN